MSWLNKKDERSWIQRLCTHIIKVGPIPQHVAFILDGNRRFAVGQKLKSVVEGHKKGFEKVSETLAWCQHLGIVEITLYVFSIENFKRSKEELKGLMSLVEENFRELLTKEELLMQEGICIQIIGDWSLIPKNILPAMAKAMTLTRYNTRSKWNIAFAYTSRNEITRGIKLIQHGLVNGDIKEEDVDSKLLEDCFYIIPSKPLDLLIRTSGETRLSDFLLWQSTEAVICFIQVLWPEFNYWNMLSAIFQFQKANLNLQIKKSEESVMDSKSELRKQEFIEKIRGSQWKIVNKESLKFQALVDNH